MLFLSRVWITVIRFPVPGCGVPEWGLQDFITHTHVGSIVLKFVETSCKITHRSQLLVSSSRNNECHTWFPVFVIGVDPRTVFV